MKKGAYVDGFVLAIPKANIDKYKKMAKDAMSVWLKFGALDYKECICDDPTPDTGGIKAWNFPAMVKTKENEVVWFSFITYKSRAHRDSVNKKVMKHFNQKYGDKKMEMPFDMKRMCFAGFKVEVGE